MIQPIESIGIDARVGLENKRGTVKFAGHLTEINDGNELWLGIDWDRPDHGKHNGTLKGKQYFQARYELLFHAILEWNFDYAYF